MRCPDANILAELSSGELDDATRDEVIAHIGTCPRCERELVELARALAPDHPDEQLPTGRYEIVGELGYGGMGVVYEAYDPLLERRVAIKRLRPDVGTGAASPSATLLLREARSLARVHHPNVLAIHDVGLVEGAVYVVTELVDGRSADVWLREARPDWREILDVYQQAGRGLAEVHVRGLVHRDVKPQNIFVDDEGGVRLGDFGLASRDPTTTQPAGTPAYMSPEQRRGDAIDHRSDQFSLALSLAEALTGLRPAPGTPADALARSSSSEVPKRIWTALARSLCVDPTSRFENLDAFLSALEPDGRDTGMARAQPRAARWWIAALGLGVIALVAAVVSWTTPAAPAPAAKPSPPVPIPTASPGPVPVADLGMARAGRSRAAEALGERDGSACLVALDEAAASDPEADPLHDQTRAHCEMLAGRCEDGRKRLLRFYEGSMEPTIAERVVEHATKAHCPLVGDDLEFLLPALAIQVSTRPMIPARCRELESAAGRIETLLATPNSAQVIAIANGWVGISSCWAIAGDCSAAQAAAGAAAKWYTRAGNAMEADEVVARWLPQCAPTPPG